MERDPVMTPRPMRKQRPSLERVEIWTLRRMRMGKAERKKSERMDITGFEFVRKIDRKSSDYGILTSL